MFKKITLILLLIICFACSKQENNHSVGNYIEPANNLLIYDLLDKDVQNKIKKVSKDRLVQNYQLKSLFKDIFDFKVKDINGEYVDIKKFNKVIIEIVSHTCSHCRNQLRLIHQLSARTDILFVQYFNNGDSKTIYDFYRQEDIEIPENIVIIPENEQLKDYFTKELRMKYYPTFMTFNNKKLSFVISGELDLETFDELCQIGFFDTLKQEDFYNQNDENIIDLVRDTDDIKNDLSSDNYEKLKNLNDSNNTTELTLSNIGKTIDFSNLSDSTRNIYINEIEDFSIYEDKKVIVIYTYFKRDSETDKVEFINSLIDSNDEYEYIVALFEGLESTSIALSTMNIKFKCPVISLSSYVPVDLSELGIVEYPSAVFIENATITGIISNIESIEQFSEAISLFLSNESIAYIENN